MLAPGDGFVLWWEGGVFDHLTLHQLFSTIYSKQTDNVREVILQSKITFRKNLDATPFLCEIRLKPLFPPM